VDERRSTTNVVRDALRQVMDPEAGMNIVDLGLVYGIERRRRRRAVQMTMTSAACPMADMIVDDAHAALAGALPPGTPVEVELVWDPPWTPGPHERAGARPLRLGAAVTPPAGAHRQRAARPGSACRCWCWASSRCSPASAPAWRAWAGRCPTVGRRRTPARPADGLRLLRRRDLARARGGDRPPVGLRGAAAGRAGHRRGAARQGTAAPWLYAGGQRGAAGGLAACAATAARALHGRDRAGRRLLDGRRALWAAGAAVHDAGRLVAGLPGADDRRRAAGAVALHAALAQRRAALRRRRAAAAGRAAGWAQPWGPPLFGAGAAGAGGLAAALGHRAPHGAPARADALHRGVPAVGLLLARLGGAIMLAFGPGAGRRRPTTRRCTRCCWASSSRWSSATRRSSSRPCCAWPCPTTRCSTRRCCCCTPRWLLRLGGDASGHFDATALGRAAVGAGAAGFIANTALAVLRGARAETRQRATGWTR
jgi:metal-sulfur cluster biosynthetic enzyme